MNMMTKKNLIDASRWMPIGLVLMAILIGYCMRTPNYYEHFSSNLFYSAWLVAGIFGLFLSLATFCRENDDNARTFLIHRGISIDQIFRSRVGIGLLIYFLTLMLPIGTVAIYFWAIGMDSIPVSPWQTVPAMVAVFYSTAFYFAGVMIACRNCRWLGTRCLPLSLAIGVSATACALLAGFSWSMFCFQVLGVIGLYILMNAARQTFLGSPMMFAPSCWRQSDRQNWTLSGTLLGSSILVTGLICLSPLYFQPSHSAFAILLFSPEGDPWIAVRKSLSPYEDTLTPLLGADTQSEPPTPPRPEDRRAGWSFRSIESVGNRWDCSRIIMLQNVQGFYSSGHIFVYTLTRVTSPYTRSLYEEPMNLSYVISSDRVSLPGEPLGTPFASQPCDYTRDEASHHQFEVSLFGKRVDSVSPVLFLLHRGGFLYVDLANRTVEKLIDQPMIGGSLDLNLQSPPTRPNASYAFHSGNELSFYRKMAKGPSGNAELQLEGKIQLAEATSVWSTIFFKDIRNWSIVEPSTAGSFIADDMMVTRSVDGRVTTYEAKIPETVLEQVRGQKLLEAPFIAAALPPILTLSSLIVFETTPIIVFAIPYILGQMAISIFLVWIACRIRKLPNVRTIGWCVVGLALGFGTWIAILAIYPRVYTTTCSQCKGRRRVDLERCEHCGSEWDAPAFSGIEIYQMEPSFTPLTTASSVS